MRVEAPPPPKRKKLPGRVDPRTGRTVPTQLRVRLTVTNRDGQPQEAPGQAHEQQQQQSMGQQHAGCGCRGGGGVHALPRRLSTPV